MGERFMRTRRVWCRLVVGVVVTGLLAAGCSTDPKGSAQPTEEPTRATTVEPSEPEPSSPAPAPEPTPWPEPTRPPEMARNDVEGAKAAAEYFLALFTYVHLTGDLAAWNDISHPDCMFCSDVAVTVRELYGTGGYADGPVLEVNNIDGASPDGEYEFFSVWIDAEERQSARYDTSGEVIQTFERSDFEVDLALAWVDGEWRVRGAVGRDVEPEQSDG